jgi:hypothetical protein
MFRLFQMLKIDILVVELKNVKNIWVTYGTWLRMATQSQTKCTCLKNCNKVSRNCKRKCVQTNSYTHRIRKIYIDVVMTIQLTIIQILQTLVGVEGIVRAHGRWRDRLQETVSLNKKKNGYRALNVALI